MTDPSHLIPESPGFIPVPSKWRVFADFFGLKRSIIGLLGMCILIGMGEKMAERFLPIYLVALGGGPILIAVLNALDNLLSALYSFPGGWLANRIGTRKSLLVFNLVAMLGFGIVLVFQATWAVLAGAVLFISWTALSLPATMGLIAEVLPKSKRTMGVSVHSLIRRIPMALGPILGGALVTQFGAIQGVRYAFCGALMMTILSLIFQQVMISEKPMKSEKSMTADEPAIHLSAALKKLLIADILVRFCEQIPYPFVVLWCMNIHGINGIEFGILTTVEMITAILIYIPVAFLADRGVKKPFVVATFCFFTLFPVTLWFSRSFWPLVLAFIVRGLKEFGEPTRKALILDLAPPGREAAAFGVYYLYRDIFVTAGALLGGFLWQISPATNLFVAFVFGMMGTVWFALVGTDPLPDAHSIKT
ncbi:MAG: MFS transporter [Candidatus Ozemobacteraceae bacterium]